MIAPAATTIVQPTLRHVFFESRMVECGWWRGSNNGRRHGIEIDIELVVFLVRECILYIEGYFVCFFVYVCVFGKLQSV